jgi:hypothetical protein
VKIGDLIKITRQSIGIPKGTVGMVLDITFSDSGFRYFNIQMFGLDNSRVGFSRRYLGRDLELVSKAKIN